MSDAPLRSILAVVPWTRMGAVENAPITRQSARSNDVHGETFNGVINRIAGMVVIKSPFPPPARRSGTLCAAVNVNPRASRPPWRPGNAPAQGGNG